MRILVLSNAFEHPYDNARLRYQCDFLTNEGHEIKVYTEPWDTIKFKHEYPIIEIGEKSTKYLKWWWLSVYSLFTNYKERKFAYQVMWHSRKFRYDVVFCSTNSCFPLGAAAMIAKIKGVPLFVDLTDLAEQSPLHIHYSWWHPFKALKQRIYTKRRNQALQQAQWITTLSEEHVQQVKLLNPNVTLLYNGFDPKQFYYEKTSTDLFKINYVGYAYSSQNIDMILHVMDKFRNEMPKAQWMFYSNDLKYNHIKHSRPNICGLVPKEIVGDTIRQASIILLFNDTEDNGLASEQFYQALGCEKPVLFTAGTDGAIPNLIQLTNLGLATNRVKECMNYILDYYHQWEQDGFTHRDVQNKELFNAEKQTKQLEQILLQLINKQA